MAVMLADSNTAGQRLNDEPSIVATSGTAYVRFKGYTANDSSYDVYAIVGTGNP